MQGAKRSRQSRMRLNLICVKTDCASAMSNAGDDVAFANKMQTITEPGRYDFSLISGVQEQLVNVHSIIVTSLQIGYEVNTAS